MKYSLVQHYRSPGIHNCTMLLFITDLSLLCAACITQTCHKTSGTPYSAQTVLIDSLATELQANKYIQAGAGVTFTCLRKRGFLLQTQFNWRMCTESSIPGSDISYLAFFCICQLAKKKQIKTFHTAHPQKNQPQSCSDFSIILPIFGKYHKKGVSIVFKGKNICGALLQEMSRQM